MSAACAAAAEGSSVLLLEHTDRIGGTTAVSGGMVWIPANSKMPTAGVQDSPANARRYLDLTVPGSGADERMQAYLGHGDEIIAYLESHTSLRMRPVNRYPDYYPATDGATVGGRVLEPVPFDGRELGSDFRLLRDPLPEFLLFGGMMISRADIPHLLRASKSLTSAWHVFKLLCRHGNERRRAHRGTTLVLGNALAARLFKSARDLNVRIETGVEVESLSVEDGRVVGLRARIGGASRELRARAGVVLATGGISHDTSLRSLFVPPEAGQVSAAVDAGASRGGVRLAVDVGAATSPRAQSVDKALAFWVPASTWRRKNGSLAVFPHTVSDRAKPGLIAVNQSGQRFVNEALSYHEFVRAQLREGKGANPAWLICDRRFLWKYGLGKVRPFTLSTRRNVASGYLHKASTVEALASSIGVDPAALSDTVRRFNADARQGLDRDFGKGGDIYQRHLGDGDHQPNPCVAPIEEAPFYAVAVVPADLGMAAGLMSDANARVLRSDGTPIDGLYACGNDLHSIMNGAYPGPGITLGPAIVFGVLAARHALSTLASSQDGRPREARSHREAAL